MATFDTIPNTDTAENDTLLLIRKNGAAHSVSKENLVKEVTATANDAVTRVGGAESNISNIQDSLVYTPINVTDTNVEKNKRYYIEGNVNVILPDTAGVLVGDTVRFTKSQAVTPTITVANTGAESVKTVKGSDTVIGYDINSEVIFTYTGSSIWEV